MRATMQRDLGGNHTLLGRGAEKAGLSRYHTKQAQSESYTVTNRASASTVAPPPDMISVAAIAIYVVLEVGAPYPIFTASSPLANSLRTGSCTVLS